MPSVDSIAGVLLGTAVGDSLGLPFEGLDPIRIARRLDGRPLAHRMLFGRGLISDDTEHASMVARALAESSGDVDLFTRSFARQLQRWVLALPPGVGLATLRGAVRLLVGVSPERSGVDSAGNGPAMRSALLGVCARSDEHLVDLVRASTRMTHTDPRAEDGAVLIARFARHLATGGTFVADGFDEIRDPELRSRVLDALGFEGDDLEAYRRSAGYQRGVSGFIVHTVPAAVYCVCHHRGDAKTAIEAAIRLGGDTDTTAAIVGALLGATHGASGLPLEWLEGVRDWPISTDHLRDLAVALGEGTAPPPQRWLASIPRNLGLVLVIVGHLMLRLVGR